MRVPVGRAVLEAVLLHDQYPEAGLVAKERRHPTRIRRRSSSAGRRSRAKAGRCGEGVLSFDRKMRERRGRQLRLLIRKLFGVVAVASPPRVPGAGQVEQAGARDEGSEEKHASRHRRTDNAMPGTQQLLECVAVGHRPASARRSPDLAATGEGRRGGVCLLATAGRSPARSTAPRLSHDIRFGRSRDLMQLRPIPAAPLPVIG